MGLPGEQIQQSIAGQGVKSDLENRLRMLEFKLNEHLLRDIRHNSGEGFTVFTYDAGGNIEWETTFADFTRKSLKRRVQRKYTPTGVKQVEIVETIENNIVMKKFITTYIYDALGLLLSWEVKIIR